MEADAFQIQPQRSGSNVGPIPICLRLRRRRTATGLAGALSKPAICDCVWYSYSLESSQGGMIMKPLTEKNCVLFTLGALFDHFYASKSAWQKVQAAFQKE